MATHVYELFERRMKPSVRARNSTQFTMMMRSGCVGAFSSTDPTKVCFYFNFVSLRARWLSFLLPVAACMTLVFGIGGRATCEHAILFVHFNDSVFCSR